MDDNTAQPSFNPSQPPSAPVSSPVNQEPLANEPTLSYVDNYAPPGAAPQVPPATLTPPPVMSAPVTPPAPAPLATDGVPPAVATPTNYADPGEKKVGQSLEEQNIFDMLGAGEASDQEKEAFLDELQQVIWEDFLENDVELLITDSEKVELKQIQDKAYPDDLQKQEAIVVFLEKLIPDLEDIMLEKALELKRDMFMERLQGMKDSLTGQTDKLDLVSAVETLVSQDKWNDAILTLNRIT